MIFFIFEVLLCKDLVCWFWNFAQLVIHFRTTCIQKISLIWGEMRTLCAHKVCMWKDFEDFLKLWYAITPTFLCNVGVCNEILHASLLRLYLNAQKQWQWSDARCLCSTRLKFAHAKRVIFDNSSFCSLFGFLCNVGVYYIYILSKSNGYSTILPSKISSLTVTSDGARYHNLWFCDWYIPYIYIYII